MLRHETLDGIRSGLLADRVSHVDREKVGSFQEAVDGLQVDMIGIDEVGSLPTKRGNGLVGLLTQCGGLGADQIVLTVGLIPDGRHFDTLCCCFLKRSELSLSLVTETIADTEGEFREFHE